MARGDTLVVWTAWSNDPPEANGAVPDVRNGQPVLDFDDSIAESAVFSAFLPRHYSGAGVAVTIGWSATSAVLELVATGDASGKLSGWSLSGASLANSDRWTWYWDYFAPEMFPGIGTVTLWKDPEKTQKVAEGSATVPAASGTATVALAAQNDSGLSGSVVVGFEAPTENDGGNRLCYPRVAWQVAFERHEDDADSLDADGFAAGQTVYDVPATLCGELSYCTATVAAGEPLDGLVAGEHFRLRVTRDAPLATGNMSGDAELVFVELREA